MLLRKNWGRWKFWKLFRGNRRAPPRESKVAAAMACYLLVRYRASMKSGRMQIEMTFVENGFVKLKL